ASTSRRGGGQPLSSRNSLSIARGGLRWICGTKRFRWTQTSRPAFDLPTGRGIKSTSSANEVRVAAGGRVFGRPTEAVVWPRDRIHEWCAAFSPLRFVHVSRMVRLLEP